MRKFKHIVLCGFILLLILLVLAFMLENQQSVALVFIGWSSPQLPVSLILMLALLIGMLAGPVISWLLGRSSRASRKRIA